MQVTVTTIVFGLPQGQRTSQVDVLLPKSTLSLQDLIAHKVAQEVVEIQTYRRLHLGGEYLTPETLILSRDDQALGTAEDEVQRAQKAFLARDFMIVIDNRQVWNADTVVDIHPDTRIEFIKILPLVGG